MVATGALGMASAMVVAAVLATRVVTVEAMHVNATIRSATAAAAGADSCAGHMSCATCLLAADRACGWCTGDIGGGNPGRCMTSAQPTACHTILETAKCPNCHLPWIRFVNTVPSSNRLDCTITQGKTTYTWSNVGFAQFSVWMQKFAVGDATISISSGGKELVSVVKALTPGPLVVAVKDLWPKSGIMQPSAVETIAASYSPIPPGKAGVRLFNLSPLPESASSANQDNSIGMRTSNPTSKMLVDEVKYSLGSAWINVDRPEHPVLLDIIDDGTHAPIYNRFTFNPPPGASTVWVLGTRGDGVLVKMEVDAPQVCGGAPDVPAPSPPAPRPPPSPSPRIKFMCDDHSNTCVEDRGTNASYTNASACALDCEPPMCSHGMRLFWAMYPYGTGETSHTMVGTNNSQACADWCVAINAPYGCEYNSQTGDCRNVKGPCTTMKKFPLDHRTTSQYGCSMLHA